VAKKAIAKDLRQVELVDGRAGADTIKLWEHYRDHAYMWRAICLLQLPGTFLALVAALLMYYTADTVIEVPEKPKPGHFSVKQLPDSEFIDIATKVVNLMTTYQPHSAKEQFYSARELLWEPALSEFERAYVKDELKVVEETNRSQMFFIDPKLMKVERVKDQDKITVRIAGVRQKLISQRPQPPEEMVFYVKMTTIPRNIHNEYGIVVVDLRLRMVQLTALAAEDKLAELEREKADARATRKGMREGVTNAQPIPSNVPPQ